MHTMNTNCQTMRTRMNTSITRIKKRILTSNSVRILLVLPSANDVNMTTSSSPAAFVPSTTCSPLVQLRTIPLEVPSLPTVKTPMVSPRSRSGDNRLSLFRLQIDPTILSQVTDSLKTITSKLITNPNMMIPTRVTLRTLTNI